MKKIFLFVVLSLISFYNSYSEVNIKDSIETKYETSFQKIVTMHKEIKSMYKSLEKLQPVAIAKDNYFYIFDVDENSTYKFIKKAPVNFPIPKGIRAAMPLEAFDYKTICVVTEDVFENTEEIIILFHEFVHCYQFQTVEMKLKENLKIYKKAMENHDYMWEINYGFPYKEKEFEVLYGSFIKALENQDTAKIKETRVKLKSALYSNEFEYMTWQEWKEGYARFIENKLRKFYNIKINDYGKEVPYSRISFYYGGSKYIEYLSEKNPQSENDLEFLYQNIYN